MKLITTFLLVALSAFAAHAQIRVPLEPCITDRPDLPVPTAARPAGLPPQLGGQCGAPIIEVNAIGVALVYWCAQPAPNPARLVPFAVRREAITPALLLDLAQLGLPGDNSERIRAMLAKYQTSHFGDMCDVWGPARERINSAMPAPIAAPVWKVAPNPSSTTTPPTRPSFAVVNGVRATTSKTRAIVDAPCDPALTIKEASTYMQVAPGFVAICVKTAP